ncbi:MAG: hypothetical protein JJ863_03035 [Deltaproteobacteria bacterium]|nr:hypothetical protein [Deltaproteobacteria bacterium]
MKRLKKVAKWFFVALLLLVATVVVWGLIANEPRPEGGETGEAADTLARRVQSAVGYEGWEELGAIAFDFAGANRHLWDRERGYAYVTWGDLPSPGGASDAGDTEVWLRLGDRSGVVKVDGEVVRGEEADALREDAWGRHINDTFWLYPFRSFFDEGVTRKKIGDALYIEYASGGATPGDGYLWHLDSNGRPTRWQMWVSIIPVGGVEATWARWETTSEGVAIATEHEMGPLGLVLANIRTAESAPELAGGEDPFAPLH